MNVSSTPSLISSEINSTLKKYNAGCYVVSVKDKEGNQLAKAKLVKY